VLASCSGAHHSGRETRRGNASIVETPDAPPIMEGCYDSGRGFPRWVGTEQVRSLTVDGERLQVLSPWRVNPNWPEKGMTRSIVTFVRSK
jgi:hypothetical protein